MLRVIGLAIILSIIIAIVYLPIFIYKKYFAKQKGIPTIEPLQTNKAENIINKVKCNDFVETLEKDYKLLKNGMITEVEFNDIKQKQIIKVVQNKVEENPEDFITVIIDLKTSGILGQEDILRIKEAILPRNDN